MRDRTVEEKRKYFKDSVYLKYENLKCTIAEKNESENIKIKNKIKLNRLQKVAAFIIAGTVSITAYAGISKNVNMEKMGLLKLSENYEDSLVEINQSVENEYCNITLESMAGDKAYIIAEYKIKLKDKAFEKMTKPIEYIDGFGYDLYISKKVFVNSKELKNISEYVDKISDNEYVYTQIINIMDENTNNLKLEIGIENISSGIIYGFESGDNQAITIGKTIKSEIELKGNENTSILSEQQIDEHTKIVIEKIANTKFQNFIKAKKIVDGVTYKEYNENSMEYISFNITDENNNSIPSIIYGGASVGKKIYVKENGQIKEDREYEIKQTDTIIEEENIIILFSSENTSNKLKVTPVKSKIFEDRKLNENGKTQEEEMYDKATWYPLKSDKKTYTATSGLGGNFIIQNIDINDENITFYYDENGCIGNEWKILIREKIDDMNYIFPVEEQIKGVNSNENKIVFSRNPDLAAGLNLHKMSLDNIDNLEFTLLFGCTTEKIGNSINLDVPTQDEQTATINNLKIVDFEKNK